MTSCVVYTTSTANLQTALENGQPQAGKTQIKVIDKNGQNVILTASSQKSIRITKNDNTRQQFYFVTTSLKDSIITGSQSTFFNMPIKPIKLSEIKLIELDGR